MKLRLFVPGPLQAHSAMALPPGAVRHAQVRRVQPGDTVGLFDGSGFDWPALVQAVGRSSVEVQLGAALAVHTELPVTVTLALGMPANERMDSLVEKATELGVAHIQPLVCERSVLRLSGERAERKREHWQAIAQAACEQCGRARVPQVATALHLQRWLADQARPQPATTAPAGDGPGLGAPADGVLRLVLSLRANAAAPSAWPLPAAAVVALSGPEGGLSVAEEAAACAAGFSPASLGPRILRADTAPLVLLAWFGLQYPLPWVG